MTGSYLQHEPPPGSVVAIDRGGPHQEVWVSNVLDPLGAADVVLLSGEEAWDLPAGYIAQGGKAKGYDPEEGGLPGPCAGEVPAGSA